MFRKIKKISQKSIENIRNGNVFKAINNRVGFFYWLVTLFWLKTIFAYFVSFGGLRAHTIWDNLILLLNPIGFTLVAFGIALYFKRTLIYYSLLYIIDFFATLLLFLNVLYYREFTDYISINTILGYHTINKGFDASAIPFASYDFVFWIDLLLIIVLMIINKVRVDRNGLPKGFAFKITTIGILLFSLDLFCSDIIRPQLLTRQFDREYLVRYLGIGPYTIFDGISTQQIAEKRKSAKATELEGIEKYIKDVRYAKPNKEMFGIAKNRNVIIIHLESFQQMSIDKKINGQEVTPFLNSLYHSKDTYSFDNFFHQVGQGKTSDAENMLETSTFGLPQGSLFSKLGADQTFQAMPAILRQRAGYTSAVFHGNYGSFWNRNLVYKRMGIDNFIDGSYFNTSGDRSTAWGLKDKLMFKDSIPYLEQLQQPFYAKFLTVTNHTPYTMDQEDLDPNFTTSDTGSSIVDNYWLANHYLDQAVKEFFDYLKASGLYENSMIVLYGDHYGIPNSDNKALAPLLDKNPDEWTDFDNVQLQRVPFMINIPGNGKGYIDHTYGGEIDVAPTIEHLLGITTKRYIQFGQDLFSPDHKQLVAFRDKTYVTPDYTSVAGGDFYRNSTGEKINLKEKANAKLAKKAKEWQDYVDTLLKESDSLNEKNLLRFYHPKDFTPVDSKNYDYNKEATLQRLKEEQEHLKSKSTSWLSEHHNESGVDLYKTDAPQVNESDSDVTRIKPEHPEDNE